MRIKTKLKSQKIRKNTIESLKKLETKISAGYPSNNPASYEKDLNGDIAIEKAYKINFTDKKFTPFLQVSYQNNISKYKKTFTGIVKSPIKKQNKKLDLLGKNMVEDIKETISITQLTPSSTNKGCIYGTVNFERVKK